MVPVLQCRLVVAEYPMRMFAMGKVAWGTQATWHHVHFGLKPASHGFATGTPVDDFRPERLESSN